jgi:hypothetical protein
VLGQPDRVTVMVDGMEVLDGFASAHMPRDNIGGLNDIDALGERPRIVGRDLPRPDGVG